MLTAYFAMLVLRLPAFCICCTQTLISLYAANQPLDSMSEMSINPTHPGRLKVGDTTSRTYRF